ncbi:MAG: hypothetical protein JW913_01605 [Chitinispirillaceae bacterium]|nr:hypothetical protein [Chitinispirillaceae bacterium]
MIGKCFASITTVCLFAVTGSTASSDRLALDFFGTPTCGECLQIKQEILFPMQKKHPEINLRIHDIDTDSGYGLLISMEEAYNVPLSAAIELYFPDTFLTGAKDINAHALRLIMRYLADPATWQKRDFLSPRVPLREQLAEKFRGFSFISILTAGIIDGINPCAIATMIFLISFLATQKRKRGEILAIGLSFTATVFITYLAMGIGAFKALTFLQKYTWISTAIRWSAAALAVGVGVMSFRDAYLYRKTGKASDIKLQLPKVVKLRIHKVISGNLSGGSLVIGAIITGFLVTLLEAVCTGQVYLPTIVLMTRQEGLRMTGWFYLVFYNILFVFPLLIVMVLAFYGLKWDRLAKTTQKNMVPIKIALGGVLCALAIFIVAVG